MEEKGRKKCMNQIEYIKELHDKNTELIVQIERLKAEIERLKAENVKLKNA